MDLSLLKPTSKVKIDPEKLKADRGRLDTQLWVDNRGNRILDTILAFYDVPENQAAFEAWQAERGAS